MNTNTRTHRESGASRLEYNQPPVHGLKVRTGIKAGPVKVEDPQGPKGAF